jgi:hypothetical protein
MSRGGSSWERGAGSWEREVAGSKLSCGLYPSPLPPGKTHTRAQGFDSAGLQREADEKLTSSTTWAAPFVFENGRVTAAYLKTG